MPNLESFSTEEIIREFRNRYNFELYGTTIENFLRLYDIEYWKYIVTYSKWIPLTITRSVRFKIEIKNLIFENAELIMDFHKEYYEKSYSLKTISKVLKYSVTDIKEALKKHFQSDNFQHLLVAKHFTRKVSDIPDNATVWNITLNHIIKILENKSPKLNKPLTALSYKNNLQTQPLIRKRIFDTGTNGYTDYEEILFETLVAITDPETISLYDIEFPGGILFYGPPGCGKTFWAETIAKYTNYQLIPITRSEFGSSYIEGSMLNLKKKLEEVQEKSNVILFFDEFDSVVPIRGGEGAAATENRNVVNTLLQEIPKLIERKILLIAASNFISSLDPAIIRDLRFDTKIPIFPPLPIERIKILINQIQKFSKNSKILSDIFKESNANSIEFWYDFINELNLLPASSIIKLGKNLKSKIASLHRNSKSLKLTKGLVQEVILNVRSGLIRTHIQDYIDFYNEISSTGIFYPSLEHRREQLLKEIGPYLNDNQKTRFPVGFR